MKVACEDLVTAGAASSAIVRPGLIVGSDDPSGRFTYWPSRMARLLDGGATEVLAPGRPADLIQVIDVRDLSAWIVDLAESRTEGVFDGVGPVLEMSELLSAVARGCGVEPQWVWASREELEAQEVVPWSGERSLPLWLPRPEYDGMPAHDSQPSLDAGLAPRPIQDTARDTLEWLRSARAEVTGLTAAEEAEVLSALRGAAG